MYEDYFGFNGLPFSVTPDPRFFYNNSVYREAFATLAYGIEERKGFILITGEVGTGKTTLLKVFMRNARSTIHTAFVFNPKLSFGEFLRAMLTDLEIPHDAADDRFTLVEKLNAYLIDQLKKHEIVALLVDEAQNLDDVLLEELRLLSNLETTKDKLLQIVLIGQPELEEKLNDPRLRQLKQRVAQRCRLLPLKTDEVYEYIESRLKTVGYQGKEIFDVSAVEKITLYSRGIPRLINMICDNALLIAYAASKKKVSAATIEEVARDLQLSASMEPSRSAPQRIPAAAPAAAEERDEAKTIQEEMPFDWISRHPPMEFADDFREVPRRAPAARQRSRAVSFGAGVFLGFILAAALGALFYSRPNFAEIADHIGTEVEKKAVELVRTSSAPVVPPLEPAHVDAPPRRIEESESVNQEPIAVPARPEAPPAQVAKETTLVAPRAEAKRVVKDERKERLKAVTKRPADMEAPADNEKLEFDVYKAIYNRAIQGVEVSVKDGTVYLTGRVATERQKLAAAQAARGVGGVKNVSDRIVVTYGDPARYTDARSR